MDSDPRPVRLAFVPGVTPDKWARVWRQRHGSAHPLELLPIEQSAQREVLDAGTADLVLARLPHHRAELIRDDLHCVVLYDEVQVVVAGREHFVAAAEEVTTSDLDEEQLLLPHPSGWLPSTPQQQTYDMTPRQAIEVAAAGAGIAIVPMSVGMVHRRKDVVNVPVADLRPTQIAVIWRKVDDSPLHQDLVGVTRGRKANSSRG